MVAVPNTGSWGTFQWVGKGGVNLTAGQHILKMYANAQYFNLDKIRTLVDPQTESPYTGTPFAVPAQFEAEDFDNGGEGVAYHDNTPGNQGGQYRPNEDVDIVTISGGYAVNNFETGEWSSTRSTSRSRERIGSKRSSAACSATAASTWRSTGST